MRRNYLAVALSIAALIFSITPSNAAIWAPDITPQGSNLIGVNIVDSFFNSGGEPLNFDCTGGAAT